MLSRRSGVIVALGLIILAAGAGGYFLWRPEATEPRQIESRPEKVGDRDPRANPLYGRPAQLVEIIAMLHDAA